jgi:hypothetical protein
MAMSTSKKSIAGKRSGIKRAKIARLRQLFVLAAFEKLKRANQIQPFATESIDVLQEERRKSPQPSSNLELALDEYQTIVPPRSHSHSDKFWALCDEVFDTLIKDNVDFASLRTVKRETLIKDLKALGIKSSRRKQRSG